MLANFCPRLEIIKDLDTYWKGPQFIVFMVDFPYCMDFIKATLKPTPAKSSIIWITSCLGYVVRYSTSMSQNFPPILRTLTTLHIYLSVPSKWIFASLTTLTVTKVTTANADVNFWDWFLSKNSNLWSRRRNSPLQLWFRVRQCFIDGKWGVDRHGKFHSYNDYERRTSWRSTIISMPWWNVAIKEMLKR